jgi:8-oxo-dGTP pyrophosphatase MutT (NUDIX family)
VVLYLKVKQRLKVQFFEETGIKVSTDDLIVLYSYVDKPKHAIYHSYLNLIEKEVHVTLQEGETMDYMYVPYKEFDELVNSDRFVPSEQRRYKNQAVFTMLSRFIPDSAAST